MSLLQHRDGSSAPSIAPPIEPLSLVYSHFRRGYIYWCLDITIWVPKLLSDEEPVATLGHSQISDTWSEVSIFPSGADGWQAFASVELTPDVLENTNTVYLLDHSGAKLIGICTILPSVQLSVSGQSSS